MANGPDIFQMLFVLSFDSVDCQFHSFRSRNAPAGEVRKEKGAEDGTKRKETSGRAR